MRFGEIELHRPWRRRRHRTVHDQRQRVMRSRSCDPRKRQGRRCQSRRGDSPGTRRLAHSDSFTVVHCGRDRCRKKRIARTWVTTTARRLPYRRSGGRGDALHRRADAGPSRLEERRGAGARREDGHRRSRQEVPARGNGVGRRDVRRDRRHRRLDAPGREIPRQLHHHAHGGDAFGQLLRLSLGDCPDFGRVLSAGAMELANLSAGPGGSPASTRNPSPACPISSSSISPRAEPRSKSCALSIRGATGHEPQGAFDRPA